MPLRDFESWIRCNFSYCFPNSVKQTPVGFKFPDFEHVMIGKVVFVSTILMLLASGPSAADNCPSNIIKVPCRDMGDGRTLINSLYLPDGYDSEKSSYTILNTQPTSMQGEWANLVCTIEIK